MCVCVCVCVCVCGYNGTIDMGVDYIWTLVIVSFKNEIAEQLSANQPRI